MEYLHHVKRHNTLQTVLLWACLMIPASAFLYGVSSHVREAEKELVRANAQMLQEQERARVLRAEWAYLNNPKTLATSVKKHLAPKQIPVAAQMARLDDVSVKIALRTDPALLAASNAVKIEPAATTPAAPLLARPVAYATGSLASLHESAGARIPASAGWERKLVSALPPADLPMPAKGQPTP